MAFSALPLALKAQIRVSGKIWKGYQNEVPASGIIVTTSSGAKAISNDSGYYQIEVYRKDTLKVFEDNRLIVQYPFLYISTPRQFNIYLSNVNFYTLPINQLADVKVISRNYKQDSINTRAEYADIFNYKKEKLNMGNNKLREKAYFMGQEFDLDTKDKKLSLLDVGSLASVLSTKKNKEKKRYQAFAINNEKAGYVEHRFTPAIVEKYGNIHNDDSINAFIKKYAPSYDSLIKMNELDLGMYIINSAKAFKKEK